MPAVSRLRLSLTLVVALSAAAWLVLWVWDGSPYARYLHHVDWSEVGLAELCSRVPAGTTLVPAALHIGAWVMMIVAMMLPTTWSLLETFRRLTAGRTDRPRLTLLVVLGYLCMWCAFGLLVHVADASLHALAWRMPGLALHGWLVGAAILGVAGAYQFSALKFRCLDKCRSPLMFLSEQWHGRNARRDSFVLGVRHGAFCVGCCWALMLLMFAVGSGSLGWMLALGAVMSAEKNLAWGRKLSAPLGTALLGWSGVIVLSHLWAAR